MTNHPTPQKAEHTSSPQVEQFLGRLQTLVLEGLKHGFFEYSITCEISERGKRELLIRAGKSHKFTIPASELTS